MTDAFAAIVDVDNGDGTYKVTPQIIENDGTTHPQIKVGIVQGITPSVNDTVLVLTARNNLDNSPIQRYFSASESCGRIVGVLTAGSGFNLTGSYKFTGSVEVTQNLTVDGNLHVKGDLTVDGKSTVTGNSEFKGNLKVDGSLTVGNVDVLHHNHSDPQGGNTGAGAWLP